MKKLTIILILLVGKLSFAQAPFTMVQQDFKQVIRDTVPDPVPTTIFLLDQPVKHGFSTGPFALITSGWHELLWFVNYAKGDFSCGGAIGAEQGKEKWSERGALWGKFAPKLRDTTKTIEIFSLWELGEGRNNYWYYNSITYEAKQVSLGVMMKRTYGVGPIIGEKSSFVGVKFKLSLWIPYDHEDKFFKPTAVLTMTN